LRLGFNYWELVCRSSNGVLAILCRPTNELQIYLHWMGCRHGDW
jgi:hypothetical protein